MVVVVVAGLGRQPLPSIWVCMGLSGLAFARKMVSGYKRGAVRGWQCIIIICARARASIIMHRWRIDPLLHRLAAGVNGFAYVNMLDILGRIQRVLL